MAEQVKPQRPTAQWLVNNYPGESIRWMRERLMLTQTEFGKMLEGQTQSTIARWENGYNRPSPIFRRALARKLQQILANTPDAEWPHFQPETLAEGVAD